MLDNKDAAGVTAALRGTVKRWLTVASLGDRARSASDLAAAVSASIAQETAPIPCKSMAAALSHAQSFTRDDDGILVLGSFSAVEQARNLMNSGLLYL
jgi:folylpolyglutamate synthase/dihydropteroate synthase